MDMHRAITLALVLLSVLGYTLPAAAEPWRLYDNSTFGYSLSYPTDWRQISQSSVDLELKSADSGATFIAHAESTTSVPKLADLRGAVSSMLYAAGVPKADAIHYTTQVLHRVTFAAGSVDVRGSGKAGTVDGLVAYRAHAMYFFAASLVRSINGKPLPAATAQARVLQRMEASITVAGPNR